MAEIVLDGVTKVYPDLTSLARPTGAADRSALPIAGDDPAAKAAVARFLDGTPAGVTAIRAALGAPG